MNVCIVHGGHSKEKIYQYHIYIPESHYQFESEKLARDISVWEKISTIIIIQNDVMFAQSTGVTAWREKEDICCRKTMEIWNV